MAGCVYNRGTKHAPNWWAKYKDQHGVWRAKASGQATKDAAEKWLAAIVASVANGRVGKCRVPHRPWHSLRHTFASHFIMAGGNILTLQKLLGHGDLQTTLIYAHLQPDFMADEIAKMTFVPRLATVEKMEDHRQTATQ